LNGGKASAAVSGISLRPVSSVMNAGGAYVLGGWVGLAVVLPAVLLA
jgi:hypothetical protein